MEYVFVVLFVCLFGWLVVLFVSVFVCVCMFVISSLYEMFVAHLKTNESGAKKNIYGYQIIYLGIIWVTLPKFSGMHP